MVSWTVDDPPARIPGLRGEPSKRDVAVLQHYAQRAFRKAAAQDQRTAKRVLRRLREDRLLGAPVDVATGEGRPKPGRPIICEQYGHVIVGQVEGSRGWKHVRLKPGRYECQRMTCGYVLVVR